MAQEVEAPMQNQPSPRQVREDEKAQRVRRRGRSVIWLAPACCALRAQPGAANRGGAPLRQVGALSIAERFGQNLRLCRRRAGLLQEAVGLLASIHRTEVGLLERGERTPRIDTLVKVAGPVGVDPAEC